MTTKKECILECLENLDDSEIVSMWNEAEQAQRFDDVLLNMCDLFEHYGDITVSDFISKLDLGHYFNFNDDYYYIDGYGKICSTSDIYYIVSLDELADYIEDSEESFGNYELEEILTSFDS